MYSYSLLLLKPKNGMAYQMVSNSFAKISCFQEKTIPNQCFLQQNIRF